MKRVMRRARPVVAKLITFLSLFTMSIAGAASGRWTTQGPYGGETTQLAIYAAEPETLFAGARRGLFRSLDSGGTWQRLEVGLPASVAVQALSIGTEAPTVYVSDDNGLYRSTDKGASWKRISVPTPAGEVIDHISVRRGHADQVAVSTRNSGARISTDGGKTWSGPSPFVADTLYQGLLYAGNGVVYLGKLPSVVGSDLERAPLLKSVDGGQTWMPLLPDPPPGLYPGPPGLPSTIVESPLDANWIYLGDGGRIVWTNNGGISWRILDEPKFYPLCQGPESLAVAPNSPAELYVTCGGFGVLYCTDITQPPFMIEWSGWDASNGLSPNGVDNTTPSRIVLHPAYPTTPRLWLGTQGDGLFRTDTAGTSWSRINKGYRSSVVRALTTHPLDTGAQSLVLAGTEPVYPGATILRTVDGGSSWSSSQVGPNASFVRSIAIDPTTVDANPSSSEPFTVYASGLGAVAGGSILNAGIYKSEDAGVSWSTIDVGIDSSSGHPYMGAVRAVVLDPQSCAMAPCAAGSGPLQTLYVAGSGRSAPPGMPYRSARIYKSVDAGAHWNPSETGLPLAVEIGEPGSGERLTTYVLAMAIDPQTPSTLYVGTTISWNSEEFPDDSTPIPNGVFKSIDAGASWSLSIDGLTACSGTGASACEVAALAVDPSNPQNVLAGVVDHSTIPASPHVYRSSDAGSHWTDSSAGLAGEEIRTMAFSSDGSAAYAGISGSETDPGGVFRTADGGSHWNSMSLDLSDASMYAVALPPVPFASHARVLLGTEAGIWDYTMADDGDFDGSPSQVENSYPGGDGNGDMVLDAMQADVATFESHSKQALPDRAAANGAQTFVTVSIGPAAATCDQLNDVTAVDASTIPPDSQFGVGAHVPSGLLRFSLPHCESVTVFVRFHGGNFGADSVWRNYGPRVPGDASSFDWYSFAGAALVDGETWALTIEAAQPGNFRDDPKNILFLGGPASDRIFAHGFE